MLQRLLVFSIELSFKFINKIVMRINECPLNVIVQKGYAIRA